jgi:hypothetical protein
MTQDPLQLVARTLFRILRKDTLFFDAPSAQVACFIILYTNNAKVGATAKDIVFGTINANRLQDRDTLTEQITPEDIEHIRIAGSDMFQADNELRVAILSYSGNQCHTDDVYIGLARRDARSAKRPMPPTHRTLHQPTAQEDLGRGNCARPRLE